jgi:hypothetical protein
MRWRAAAALQGEHHLIFPTQAPRKSWSVLSASEQSRTLAELAHICADSRTHHVFILVADFCFEVCIDGLLSIVLCTSS